jgi:hypothetical protein
MGAPSATLRARTIAVADATSMVVVDVIANRVALQYRRARAAENSNGPAFGVENNARPASAYVRSPCGGQRLARWTVSCTRNRE